MKLIQRFKDHRRASRVREAAAYFRRVAAFGVDAGEALRKVGIDVVPGETVYASLGRHYGVDESDAARLVGLLAEGVDEAAAESLILKGKTIHGQL